MRVLSVNVGLPREVEWRNEVVATAIHKSPVSGPVEVRRLNLAGDRQADLSVHGGPDKAVYAYPSEHYAFWREELPGVALPWGAFGENLTVEGLTLPWHAIHEIAIDTRGIRIRATGYPEVPMNLDVTGNAQALLDIISARRPTAIGLTMDRSWKSMLRVSRRARAGYRAVTRRTRSKEEIEGVGRDPARQLPSPAPLRLRQAWHCPTKLFAVFPALTGGGTLSWHSSVCSIVFTRTVMTAVLRLTWTL
jgi:hypothetical protein